MESYHKNFLILKLGNWSDEFSVNTAAITTLNSDDIYACFFCFSYMKEGEHIE